MPEFTVFVYNFIKDMPDKERQDWILYCIIYANTIKPIENVLLRSPQPYKPLVTFDNIEELKKIRAHAPAGRSRAPAQWAPNTGSMASPPRKSGRTIARKST